MTKNATLRLVVPAKATAADKPKTARPRWWHRLRRREPTTFHKCLAVHMAGARPTSALR